jgi:anionic cell wall polymer biosynthesis LytR-Cps2A-Psr (LCP) family protein
VRYGIGAATGDIGRMKRQQAFISAMIKKVDSKGTLVNPVRLYTFLDAATRSLTTDSGLAHLSELASLSKSLKSIGLDNVQFITAPNRDYPPNPNRLELTPEARAVWRKLRLDEPLDALATDAISPGSAEPEKGRSARQGPSATPSPGPGTGHVDISGRTEAERKQEAEAAGLCA